MAFKGMYLKTGFLAAEGADVIVIWTQRKQSSANILKLVASILKGEADVVIGSRYLNGLERNTPTYSLPYRLDHP